MGWTTGFQFLARAVMGLFHFATAFRLALGPTQSPIQWAAGPLMLEVKHLGHEADHSPPSSAEIKKAWSYISTPLICLHGVVLN
jgi:hypothetical protein